MYGEPNRYNMADRITHRAHVKVLRYLGSNENEGSMRLEQNPV
jgi:hypothetical protein